MTPSILNAIGNTPVIEIKRLNPNPKVKILAKLEYVNPGGSIKDRPALQMIEDGIQSGRLTPDKTVIEATSGNTGIGLALVCAVKGFKLLLTMSEAVSQERRKILTARGAEIRLTPGHLGTDGAIEEVYRLARENPEAYFMADQFNNPANWQAHYYGTAEEIWRQTEGRLTHLVATLGTSGTLMGLSRRLKELNPGVQIIGVEPYLGHKIQGLKNMKEAYCPEIYEKKRLDVKVNIDDEEAYDMARQLAKVEGVFVGMSSGAAMAIACRQAEKLAEGLIVVILPDGGERYLSTPLFAVQEKIDLKIFNTLSREKESFIPVSAGKVSIYSCGPTANARIHLNACRRFVFADLLCRYMSFRGYDVTHIMNITDYDDKTIDGSEAAGEALEDFTARHVEAFKQDLDFLGVRPATAYPRASDHVQDMVRLAENLAKKGFAYEKLRSLYFDISRFAAYGHLSGVDLDKIRLGATVDLDEYEKDNPRDFTLLKRTRLSELKRGIYVKTEWGNVRPSWHIQCAAISLKHLGERFDIHTGGRELTFPHHENEIAIARAITGKPPAKYWMHCDRVLVKGKKADDGDTGLILDDLTQMGFSGREIRFWLISGHYRKPISFSTERLSYARQSLKRLDTCIQTLLALKAGNPYPELDQLIYDLKNGFTQAMEDDLNISAALASIFKVVRQINLLLLEERLDPPGAARILETFKSIDTVLNVMAFESPQLDSKVAELIQKREAARKDGNFELADRLRDELTALGIPVHDGKL